MQYSLTFKTCNGNVEDVRALQRNGVTATTTLDRHIHTAWVMQFHTAGLYQRPHWKPMSRQTLSAQRAQTLKQTLEGLTRNLHNMGSIACTVCSLDLDTLMLL